MRPLTLALVVVALLLALNLDHGLPNRYVPDDTVVRCALGIARDLSAGERPLLEALCPPDGRYTTYPMLLPWLDLVALGLRFAAGLMAGTWSGPGTFQAALFEDPGLAWLPARGVSVVLALLLPLGVARAARELRRGRREAALAALLAGSSLLVVQYAHTTRPWAPMLGFLGLTLWLSLRLLRRPARGPVLAAFAAAALCGASFQVGLVALGLPLAASAVACASATSGERRARAGRALAGVLLAAALLATLGYSHILLHGAGDEVDRGGRAAELDASAELSIGGQGFSPSQLTGGRAGAVLKAWLGYEPALLLLGFPGLLLLLRGARRGPALLCVVLPGAALGLLFLLYDGTHVRYLMVATPFLALGASAALAALGRGGGARLAAAVLFLALPLVQAARLDLLLGREDTRTEAARVIPTLLGSQRRLAVDGMGSTYGPPLLPRAEALAEVAAAGVWLGRLEQQVIEYASAGAPPAEARLAFPIQRFWRFDSYYPTDFLYDGLAAAQHAAAGRAQASDGRPIVPVSLDEWLDRFRIDAFVQVDRLPDEARRQPLTDLLARRGRLLREFSPTESSPPARAELPTDMTFPLTELWTYVRPGPWIRIWDISGRGP